MSRWRPERVVLGIDAGALVGAADGVAASAPAAGWDAASLQAALLPLQDRAPVTARLLVSADLCKHFVHQAPAGVRSLAELRELAALRAGQLFGGGPAAWAVVADWQLARPCACAALPQPLLQALRGAAQALGLALGVESALLLALQRLLAVTPRSGFVGWASPGHVVLARMEAGALHGLRCTRRPAALAGAALAAQLRRDALREGLLDKPGDTALHLAWCGPAPVPADASGGWFDASASLPAQQPRESEAAWARRLGRMGLPGVAADAATQTPRSVLHPEVAP